MGEKTGVLQLLSSKRIFAISLFLVFFPEAILQEVTKTNTTISTSSDTNSETFLVPTLQRKTVPCTEPGRFPNTAKKTGRWYWFCYFDENGQLAWMNMKCPNKRIFESSTAKCVLKNETTTSTPAAETTTRTSTTPMTPITTIIPKTTPTSVTESSATFTTAAPAMTQLQLPMITLPPPSTSPSPIPYGRMQTTSVPLITKLQSPMIKLLSSSTTPSAIPYETTQITSAASKNPLTPPSVVPLLIPTPSPSLATILYLNVSTIPVPKNPTPPITV